MTEPKAQSVREALEPLAKAADHLEKCRDDRPLWAALEPGWSQRGDVQLTVGDLRRARAALAQSDAAVLAQSGARPDNWQPERDRRVLHQAVQYEFLRQTVAELRKRIAELEEEIEKDGKELAAGFRVRQSYLDKIEQLEKALTAERQRREELEAKLAWDRFASEDTP